MHELNTLTVRHEAAKAAAAKQARRDAKAARKDANKDKALEYIEKALQLGPRQVLAHTLRGDVLMALGKPEHAIVSFFKAK